MPKFSQLQTALTIQPGDAVPFVRGVQNLSLDLSLLMMRSEAYLKTQTYSRTEVDAKFTDLVGASPETLDTIFEIATVLQNGSDAQQALSDAIGAKMSKAANGADVADPAAFRSNIGLGTIATYSHTAFALSSHQHSFGSLTGKPTTRDGYGLTDVMTEQEVLTAIDQGGGGGGIEEAPEDGTGYVRKDGEWVPEATGGSGSGGVTSSRDKFVFQATMGELVEIAAGSGFKPSWGLLAYISANSNITGNVAGNVGGYDTGHGMLSTGTTATGYTRTQAHRGFRLEGVSDFEFYSRWDVDAVSSASERYTLAVGMMTNTLNPTGVMNGAAFRHSDDVNSGKLQAVVGNGSAETSVDTGQTPALNIGKKRYKITWAGGTEPFLFFINEVQVASIPFTAIGTAAPLFASAGITKEVGTTARTLYLGDLEVIASRKYS